MDTFDVTIILAGACGVGLVFGSMVLLAKGVITLQTASDGALRVDAQNLIKIQTTYPALGLFCIGLVFILSALSAAAWSRPSPDTPIAIKGQIKAADLSAVTVYLKIDEWPLSYATDGQVAGKITPQVDSVYVEISAPGHSKPIFRKLVPLAEAKGGVVSIGEIDLGQLIKAPPQTTKIDPSTPALPPVNEAGKF